MLSTFQAVAKNPVSKRWMIFSLLMSMLAMITGPAHAIDITNLSTLGGPLSTALTQLENLSIGVRAIAGFLGFLVTVVTLIALRNHHAIFGFVLLVIFTAVGLPIGAAIMGATI
jgi:hypothetical protein